MVVARTSGTVRASRLKQNKFLSLELCPACVCVCACVCVWPVQGGTPLALLGGPPPRGVTLKSKTCFAPNSTL